MKIVCFFLFLSVLTYTGWQSQVTHQQREQQKAHELMEGYDRCVATLDESIANSRLAPDWNSESLEGKKTLKAWREARQGCLTFYFPGADGPPRGH